MGRQSRLRAQRKEQRLREASTIRVTVVSHPGQVKDAKGGAATDLELVRSTVLYADSVELMSQHFSWARMQDTLAAKAIELAAWVMDPDGQFLPDYLSGKMRSFPRGSEFINLIEDFAAEYHLDLSAPDAERRVAIADALERNRRERERERAQTADRLGLSQLQRLADMGLLSAVENGLGRATGPDRWLDPAAWVFEWWQELKTRIENGTSRLLLDADTQREAAAAVDRGLVRPGTLFNDRAGETMIGSGLIARLPAFPTAPLDELLDLRTDLTEPLTRYRAAVANLGKGSKVPVGPDSAARIDDLWISQVKPAILDIHEQMRDHGLVRELAVAAGQDIRTFLVKGTAVFVGLSALTDLTAWATAVIGVGAPAAHTAFTGWQTSAAGRAAAARADYFYLYKADKRLQQTAYRAV